MNSMDLDLVVSLSLTSVYMHIAAYCRAFECVLDRLNTGVADDIEFDIHAVLLFVNVHSDELRRSDREADSDRRALQTAAADDVALALNYLDHVHQYICDSSGVAASLQHADYIYKTFKQLRDDLNERGYG